ncbi:hypothetical protein BDQ17DRAFT_1499692 [Cyathus striatus]|nr:hypothetical protein BDQ17DRAFT_1499692 [Cyathus striatus]
MLASSSTVAPSSTANLPSQHMYSCQRRPSPSTPANLLPRRPTSPTSPAAQIAVHNEDANACEVLQTLAMLSVSTSLAAPPPAALVLCIYVTPSFPNVCLTGVTYKIPMPAFKKRQLLPLRSLTEFVAYIFWREHDVARFFQSYPSEVLLRRWGYLPFGRFDERGGCLDAWNTTVYPGKHLRTYPTSGAGLQRRLQCSPRQRLKILCSSTASRVSPSFAPILHYCTPQALTLWNRVTYNTGSGVDSWSIPSTSLGPCECRLERLAGSVGRIEENMVVMVSRQPSLYLQESSSAFQKKLTNPHFVSEVETKFKRA